MSTEDEFIEAYRTNGINCIIAERARQMHEKGYDAAHDDGHADRSILIAACWVMNDLEGCYCPSSPVPSSEWPEKLAAHVRDKYGDDHIRRLAIAGALIAAEIDRLRRAAPAPARRDGEGAHD